MMKKDEERERQQEEENKKAEQRKRSVGKKGLDTVFVQECLCVGRHI